MSISKPFGALHSTVIGLPWINVSTFNLLKYILMTYFIGLIWDIAHGRAVEMKRYLSLWYTGEFSVATWGRSRNNLFTGSNFENLFAELRLRFFSPKGQSEEKQDDVLQAVHSKVSKVRCLLIEILIIGLIFIVIVAEATSEFFTNSEEIVIFTFANRTSTARINSSKILSNWDQKYSLVSDLLFIRQCTEHKGNQTFVTRPNFVVEGGAFYGSHGMTPTYNLSLMCLYDEHSKPAKIEVHHTFIEPQKLPADLEGTETFTSDNVQHKYYHSRFIKELKTPHFSNATAPKTKRLDNEKILLFELDGRNYSCTTSQTWCVRDTGNSYEIIYVACEGGCFGSNERRYIDRNATMFLGVMPIRINYSTMSMLAEDAYMRRPPRQGNSLRDIEENINLLALGYTFGWTNQELRNQSVIVNRTVRIIPTIQIGYLVSLAVIVLCSFFVVCCHAFFSRKGKVTGLVGEHAFIDRWHGHLERDGMCDRIQNRTRIIVFGSYPGVGHLQPAVGLNAKPLSQINIMK